MRFAIPAVLAAVVATSSIGWARPPRLQDDSGEDPPRYAVPRSTVPAVAVPARSGSGNGAVFVRMTPPPSRMEPGQSAVVSITMRNVGRTAWEAKKAYKLGSQNPLDNTQWRDGRVTLVPAEKVKPGKEKTFTFPINAPARPGNYNFQWRMVREHIEWFGMLSPNVAVQVGPSTGTVPGPAPAARTGNVTLDGWQAKDDQGPFNAVGFTFFSALRLYRTPEGRAQLDRDLDAAAAAGYHFARILGEVGWGEGLGIDPAWPEYDELLTGYLRHAYSKGVRTELTIFGGSEWSMEARDAKASRRRFVERVIRLIKPLQQTLMYVEIVNEPGVARKFDDVDEMAQYAKLVKDAMPGIIVAMGSPHAGGDIKQYSAKGFPITIHLDRDMSKGPWRPERQPWDPSDYLERPWANNEPIGPGSSVAEDRDCERQKALHMMTFIGKGFATVFHSRAGVRSIPDRGYTSGQVADMPCFAEIPLAVRLLPARLPQYARKNGHWSDGPFKNLDAFLDRGTENARGAMRVYSGVSQPDFASLVLGLPLALKLECRTITGPVTVFKLHPLGVDRTVDCAPGVTFELGPGARLLRRPLEAVGSPN